MLRRLWKWISDENNRRTLAWIGGAVVVIGGAGWKVYTYEPLWISKAPVQALVSEPALGVVASGEAASAADSAAIQTAAHEMPAAHETVASDPAENDSAPSEANATPEPTETPRSQSAIARDGGIAINADGEASVSVQQSRP